MRLSIVGVVHVTVFEVQAFPIHAPSPRGQRSPVIEAQAIQNLNPHVGSGQLRVVIARKQSDGGAVNESFPQRFFELGIGDQMAGYTQCGVEFRWINRKVKRVTEEDDFVPWVPSYYSGCGNSCIGRTGRPEVKIAQDNCRTVEHWVKPSTLRANDEAF